MTATQPPRAAAHPSGDKRFKLLDRAINLHQGDGHALIEVLHTAQEAFGYLSNDLLRYVARQLKLPVSWVYGVATFYHFFSLTPQGSHSCTLCLGTACYVKRSAEILAALQQEFAVEAGSTTANGQLSLNIARCLGSCGLAPVMVVDGEVLAKQTPESALKSVHQMVAEKRDA